MVFKRLLPVDACLISSLPITGTALLIHAARCTLHAPAAGSRVMTQSGGGGRLPHFPLFLVTSHRESITCCCCYRRNATNRKQSVAMQSAKSMQSPSVLLTDDDDDDDGIMLNVVLYHQVLTKRERERERERERDLASSFLYCHWRERTQTSRWVPISFHLRPLISSLFSIARFRFSFLRALRQPSSSCV